MSIRDPITLYLQFYYVFTSLQKTGCTTNRVRFTTLQSIGSDLLISNYILFVRNVNLLCYSKWMLGCTFGKQMSLTYIFVFGNGLSNVTGLTIYAYPNATQILQSFPRLFRFIRYDILQSIIFLLVLSKTCERDNT